MTVHGEMLQFALLAGFVLAITLGLLIAACERPLCRMLAARTPARRASLAWWLLATPALAGMAYAGLTLATPALLHDSARFAAVCSAHAGNLWHLCLWHPTGHGQSAWLWGALVLVAGYAAWLGVRATAALWRHRQQLLVLLRLARRHGQGDRLLRVLESDQPMALACGVGRGNILLSTALMERLDTTQLHVVLAHEQSHVGHRDVFHRLVAALLSAIQLPGTRRRLLRELDLALEQRCDLAAAGVVGSRLTVAETIVAVEGLFRRYADRPAPLSMEFISGFVAERVQALLAPARDTARLPGRLLAVAVTSFCVLSAGWLHHVTESLFTLLAG